MKMRIGASILFPKILIASVCLLLGLTLPTSVQAADTWEVVGTAGFSAEGARYTSLAFDGSTPYVAYSDAGDSYKATVMKFPSPQAPAAVPTLNELGLIILSVLLAGISYIVIRRRQGASV